MPKDPPLPSPMPPDVRYGQRGVPNPCHDPKLAPDTMFPAERADPDGVERALRVCRHCPMAIKIQCLDWALENHEVEGVYGGTTLKHRRMIKRGRRPRAANLGDLALAA